MPDLRYASLDVGSNTVRLLLAERAQRGWFRPLRIERSITRLGGNFSTAGNLEEKAMHRTLETLTAFAALLEHERAEKIFAVGTGILREAKNGKAFVEQVRKHTGLPLRVVTGEEEADLMLKGVLGSLQETTSSRIVADVGGWSTELVWVEGRESRKMQSVPIGTVALTERFLRKDPPPEKDLESLAAWTKGVLGEIRKSFEKEGLRVEGLHPHLVGTAGTMTTIAAIDQGLTVYDPQKITGHRISRSALEKIHFHLRSIPVEERRGVPGLEKGREDLIIAGAVVALNLLEVFGLETLMAVDSGLLEGVLLDGLERMARSEEHGATR
jgi:exopolyphosphatase/guanosine-5'-triphosphate,3'-diphosphate pyrophosphatase